jgi:hypothetical protein
MTNIKLTIDQELKLLEITVQCMSDDEKDCNLIDPDWPEYLITSYRQLRKSFIEELANDQQ